MEVKHSQDLPGAEHNPKEAWTTTVEFERHEVFLEMMFVSALMELSAGERVFPDDPTIYVLRGKHTGQEIRNFAYGKASIAAISGQTFVWRPSEKVEVNPDYL